MGMSKRVHVETSGAPVIDLRRGTLPHLAAAPVGTLVYAGAIVGPSAASLRGELEQHLQARQLVLRDIGAYHFEIAAAPKLGALVARGCRFCSGDVWCGRCRRCGTAA